MPEGSSFQPFRVVREENRLCRPKPLIPAPTPAVPGLRPNATAPNTRPLPVGSIIKRSVLLIITRFTVGAGVPSVTCTYPSTRSVRRVLSPVALFPPTRFIISFPLIAAALMPNRIWCPSVSPAIPRHDPNPQGGTPSLRPFSRTSRQGRALKTRAFKTL